MRPQTWHIVLLIIVIILVFGSKRLPDVARGLGQSLKIFKNEVKDLTKSDDSAENSDKSSAESSSERSGESSTGKKTSDDEPKQYPHQQ